MDERHPDNVASTCLRAGETLPTDLYRLAFEANPAGIILVEHSGKILLANREAERVFGYNSGALSGMSVSELVPGALRAAHPARVAEFFETGTARRMGKGRELHAERRDGTHFLVEVALAPFRAGGETFVVAAVADVVERKDAEETASLRSEALERSNAALAEFASLASHDLQEPLRVIAGFADLLSQRDSPQLDETAEKYLRYIADGAKRMQQLVADLLSYSKVGAARVELREVHLERVLDAVLIELGPAVARSRASVTHEPMPVVLGDDTLLRQLFRNLLTNSLKFVGDDPPSIHVLSRPEPGSVRISVADNGIGIDPRYADRIFHMFERLNDRSQYEGNGIGLALAKRIVECHGGTIGFTSALGEGTTFTFTLRV